MSENTYKNEFDDMKPASDDDEVVLRNPGLVSSRHLLEDDGDGALADILGSTPPRARIRIKEKNKKNFMDLQILSNNIQKERAKDTVDHASFDLSDRARKRSSLKVARTRDRDCKVNGEREQRSDSLPSPNASTTLVESCKRFMSLSSRLMCRQNECTAMEVPRSRADFHQTFSMLINMGTHDRGCRRTLSREEQVWQAELKDLLWLELTAKVANRPLALHDQLLCERRLALPQLIHHIMTFRIENKGPCSYRKPIHSSESDTNNEDNAEPPDPRNTGCVNIDCPDCLKAVSDALKVVGSVLDSFFSAVALYPSSKAMTNDHPTAAKPEFDNQLKALCLWYNTSVHMRVKILALKRLVHSVKEKEQKRKMRYNSQHSGDKRVMNPDELHVRFSLTPVDEGSPRSSSDGEVKDEQTHGHNGISCPNTPEPIAPTETIASIESGYNSDKDNICIDKNRFTQETFDIGDLTDIVNLRLLGKCQLSPYSIYLQNLLKTQGVRRSTKFISNLKKHVLGKVCLTFEKLDHPISESSIDNIENPEQETEEERIESERNEYQYELRRYGWWSEESRRMQLPSCRNLFLLLSLICLEVLHEFLTTRLNAKPSAPSCFTVKQIVHELKKGMEIACEVRSSFSRHVVAALEGFQANGPMTEHLRLALQTFDHTVEDVFKQYLEYLCMTSKEKVLPRSVWELEWSFSSCMTKTSTQLNKRALDAFTDIVCNQIEVVIEKFKQRTEELNNCNLNITESEDDDEAKRQLAYKLCRDTQCMYSEQREGTLQSVALGRAFASRLTASHMRKRIFSSLMSVRECIVSHTMMILERTNIPHNDLGEGLSTRIRELLLQIYKLGFELHKELYRSIIPLDMSSTSNRRPTSLQPQRLTERLTRRKRPETIIVDPKTTELVHKELGRFANEISPKGRERRMLSLLRTDSILEDQSEKPAIKKRVERNHEANLVRLLYISTKTPEAEDSCCESEVKDDETEKWSGMVSRSIIEFANCFMTFVMDRCETGRGLRPRWAAQGLDFLMLACDPQNTRHLTDDEFEELKQLMDGCISHVIGSRPTTPRINDASISPRPPRQKKMQLQNSPSYTSSISTTDSITLTPDVDSPFKQFENDAIAHSIRVSSACSLLDESRDSLLRSERVIGQPLESSLSRRDERLRQVTFRWQRGLKIGAGTFGKVYTVINIDSGQLLAMKELSVLAADRRASARAANELKVLEGVVHPHLVSYYGCELHAEEMLLFMELCVEGSLEALVATSGGLEESLVRRYTRQLLSAVHELHLRKIVHRDIKSGNIFLTNEGNCLKLGDFGCAVKIRANSTAVGELQGTVGTQAYMAPEVFMKSSGHGRAADIWSLGCVVTEMASGKRPFAEYDSNYQIMFVVGMGGRPYISEILSQEGQQFCCLCLTHEPDDRPTAEELLSHHFLNMAKHEDDCQCKAGFLIAKNPKT